MVSEESLLQVNTKKYQSMVLGERNGTEEMNLQIGGVKIEQSQAIKLLGVNIDSDLNFSNHIREVCTKSGQQIGVRTRLRNLIFNSVPNCNYSRPLFYPI